MLRTWSQAHHWGMVDPRPKMNREKGEEPRLVIHDGASSRVAFGGGWLEEMAVITGS